MGLLSFLRRVFSRRRYDPDVGVCSQLVGHVTHGIHADAANTNMNPLIVSKVTDEGDLRDGDANGAYFFHRLNGINIVAELDRQANSRSKARERGYQNVVIWNPFAAVQGGPAQTADFLLGVQQLCNHLSAELDVVIVLMNLNADTWSGTDAEAHTLEGKGIKVLQDNGRRWACHTDRGIVADMADITTRLAAWAAEGVTTSACEFLGSHVYNLAGWVPVHCLLAQDALGRVGVTIPLALPEMAFDFVHGNAPPPANTRAGRPDLFLPPATTWTRWDIAFCRHHGIRFGLFDGPMIYESNGDLSAIGQILADESKRQPTWVEPSPAVALATGGYDVLNARDRAYRLVYDNQPGLTIPEREALGLAAGQRILDGWLFRR